MYRSVNFDNYNSWTDFFLIRSSKTISAPEPKYIKVEVEGADGELDLTEYFGDIKYKNRKLSFTFVAKVRETEFLNLFSSIQNALHGRNMKIVLEEDPDFYYFGRVTVNEWKSNKNIGEITIECDVEPYKYRTYKCVYTLDLTKNTRYIFPNLRKKVVPTFTVSAPTQIIFENSTYSIGEEGMTDEQTYIIPELVFAAGDNIVNFVGTGTVKVEYQEGGL